MGTLTCVVRNRELQPRAETVQMIFKCKTGLSNEACLLIIPPEDVAAGRKTWLSLHSFATMPESLAQKFCNLNSDKENKGKMVFFDIIFTADCKSRK